MRASSKPIPSQHRAPPAGLPVSAQDSATVTITDVAPTATVTKTASPTSVDEPGGNVTFSVTVSNTGTAESVSLTALVDDVHGDLNGQGTCSVPPDDRRQWVLWL